MIYIISLQKLLKMNDLNLVPAPIFLFTKKHCLNILSIAGIWYPEWNMLILVMWGYLYRKPDYHLHWFCLAYTNTQIKAIMCAGIANLLKQTINVGPQKTAFMGRLCPVQKIQCMQSCQNRCTMDGNSYRYQNKVLGHPDDCIREHNCPTPRLY